MREQIKTFWINYVSQKQKCSFNIWSSYECQISEKKDSRSANHMYFSWNFVTNSLFTFLLAAFILRKTVQIPTTSYMSYLKLEFKFQISNFECLFSIILNWGWRRTCVHSRHIRKSQLFEIWIQVSNKTLLDISTEKTAFMREFYIVTWLLSSVKFF